MDIIKLLSCDGDVFETIVRWNYNWWGIRNGDSLEAVRLNLEHSVNDKRLPQTFVAIIDGEPAGMYQLSMSDDLNSRPDVYPWLINVYVDEKFRGRKICSEMMKTVAENARKAGLQELYLYTKHIGLYEKFGWQFVEEVRTFRDDSPIERLYRLELI